MPPLEQSIAGIEEWNSRITLAFLGAGATVSDYTRLHEVYQARIGQAYKESADEAEKSENRRRAFLDEVRGDLDAAAPDLSTPLERSLAQIDDWYAHTAERLDNAGGDLGDYSRLGDVYLKRVDAAYLEHREVVVDTFGDIKVGVDTLSVTIGGAMDRAADAIADFAIRGKFSFSNLVDSIIADMIRMQARAAASGLGNFLLGELRVFGVPTAGDLGITDPDAFYAAHGGGIVGALSMRRTVHPSVFAGAPRYHEGGILPDEVPIIARRGEGVFTPEQMQALGGPMSISVNFENRGTPQRPVGQPSIRFDFRKAVIDIAVDDLANGGPLDRTIRSRYGVQGVVG